jgi:capsular exopolysaccharide synthesis family protein
MPRQYYSQTSIEVKPDQNNINLSGGGSYNAASDPRLAPTQFKIITEKNILYPVIDDLNLTTKWANGGQPLLKEQAYGRLLGMMQMSEVRQTDLIEIGIWSTDAKEAADIANSIARVYADQRIKIQAGTMTAGLIMLQDEVNQHQKEVTDLGATAAKLRTQLGIVDDPESMAAPADPETQSVEAIVAQVDDAKLRTAELQTQLDQVNKLSMEELLVGLHMLGIDDPTLAKDLPLYQETITEEAQLLTSGLGENHPRVKQLRAVKAAYWTQLNDAVAAIKKAMASKLELAKTTQSAMEQRLAAAKSEFAELKNQSTEYTDAKFRYLEAKRLLEAAQQRLDAEQMQRGLIPVVDKVWEPAEPALAPGKPRVFWYMMLSAAFGIALGTGLAFFLEYLDTSVKSLEDVERFLGVPVLAVIAKNVGILMHQKGDSPDAEAYRILRTNIEFNRKNPDANTLTMISGGPGEGKSTTLFNLAYTCAKGGYSVLVVDADLRRPSQHRLLGVENTVGLSNYLTSNMSFEEVVRATGVENLSFIPSGQLPRDAVGILNSQRMTDLIRNTKMKYDLVMFDSPPILGVSDGAVLASEVDLSIMVIEHRRFPRSMLQRVKQAVVNVGGNLLGVVLNKVDARHDAGYGYYGNYYDYYSTQPGEDRHPAPVAAKTNGRKPNAETEAEVHGGEQY